jgi:hypothetical protein
MVERQHQDPFDNTKLQVGAPIYEFFAEAPVEVYSSV